jgi:hypothetical protein
MFCGCSWFVARPEFPTYFHRVFFSLWEEKFEDTKGVTRSRKSKKNRQCNGRNKKEAGDPCGGFICLYKRTYYFYIMGVTVCSSIYRTELSIIYNILLNLFKMSEEKSLLISVFIVLFSINRIHF